MNPVFDAAMQRLCKWRRVFAMWQLGRSVPFNSPVFEAVVDHREATMLLRAEHSALTNLLVKKGLFTQEEFEGQLAIECEHLCRAYERQFPGFKADNTGLVMTMPDAAKTLGDFPP